MNLRFLGCLCCGLISAGCSQKWTPPVQIAPVPPPTFYVQCGDKLIPMTPEQALAHTTDAASQPSSPSDDSPAFRSQQFSASDGDFLMFKQPVDRARAAQRPAMQPVLPQPYYVRPEHSSTGYTPGAYGRLDNYTPGQHTSTGYIPGHYRADGNYTRPEHTSTGYIPGHYRAEPQPFNYIPPPITITPLSSPYPGQPRP